MRLSFFHDEMASQDDGTILYITYIKSPLFEHPSHHGRTPMTTLPVEAAMPYQHFPFFFFLVWDFCSWHCVIQGGLRIVNLLWIPCILALIKGKESVMPSCAYSGIPEILLCRFLCLLSLCILVTSDSPCEPILLIASLICDSMHAALHHIWLCATPTFS